MKSNFLTNLILGITAIGTVATACKPTKDLTSSFHEHIPQATVGAFNRDVLTYNSLASLIQEEKDSVNNKTFYKTVSIDLSGNAYVPVNKQEKPVEFLLKYSDKGIEFIKNTIQKEEANEYIRAMLIDEKKGEQKIDVASAYHVTRSKENISQGFYNSLGELEDKDTQAFENKKGSFLLYMFQSQLNGEHIYRKALEKCEGSKPAYTPTNTSTQGRTNRTSTSGEGPF
jgi:RNase H-fold protein (predicted Holliday junction resolvase)